MEQIIRMDAKKHPPPEGLPVEPVQYQLITLWNLLRIRDISRNLLIKKVPGPSSQYSSKSLSSDYGDHQYNSPLEAHQMWGYVIRDYYKSWRG